MRYISTRGGGEPKTFKEILLEGLASDGGLYMPESYAKLSVEVLREKTYTEVAFEVLQPFMSDIPAEDLRAIIEKTYTKEVFGSNEITPVNMLEPDFGLLKLSEGPTLAFKDVPLQLLGNLMEYVLAERGESLNILGATSGDTGSAAAYALLGKKNIKLFMLSPFGRMSRFQQMQMYTLDEPNIFNLVVNGTFDDCQSAVKEVNADAVFKEKYKLGAVNSINWARIAAQVVYYVYGYLHATTKEGEKVTFAVPSGNFGNALSAYVAQRMGVPIEVLVCTNENDVLDEFFKTGVYRIRKGADVKITSSPSMDIASASNFERFIFDLTGRNGGKVSDLWSNLKNTGSFDGSALLRSDTSGMRSGSASDEEVIETIQSVYKKYKIAIDPHTAVGVHVGFQLHKENQILIVDETAQPAKFADTIKEALGFEAPIPRGLEKLVELPEHTTRIDPDAEQIKKFIETHVS